jgi:ABC-type Zn uptake system ZnuABC Zn-binding protein ZnuA
MPETKMKFPVSFLRISDAGFSCRLPVFFFSLLLAVPAFAKLRVAASTTFIGEVVSAIGGDDVEVSVILPRDADPHAYEPTPRDVAKLEGESVVFENGFGLETSLQGPLKMMNAQPIDLSHGIEPRKIGGEPDPHVWLDPVCLMTWTTNIETVLAKLDAKNADGFHERAKDFREKLQKLDSWIREQVSKIPADRRVIVTDHDALGYFAARYGFKIAGTVMPGFSTLAEPSARELAAVEEIIRHEKTPAVFVEGDATPALIRRAAADTGAKIVSLPVEALGPENSETGTLAGYLRVLTSHIVEALK